MTFGKVERFFTSKDDSDYLGKGTFGSVRRCIYEEKFVVVKCFVLNGSKIGMSNIKNNVFTEAKVLHRLNHVNIIKFFGVTEWENNYGLVMEEALNFNLQDLLFELEKYIPWPLRLQFFGDIASGLEYLHLQKGLIHGDLKPQNILLDENLVAKIADFGAVSISTSALTSSLEIESSKQLTELYSPPELLKQPSITRTYAMDVYSFAMIGYEIICRKQVYKGFENLVLQLIKDLGQKPDLGHINKEEKSLVNESDKTIFSKLKEVMIKCWETVPANRPSIKDVKSSLASISSDVPDISYLKSKPKNRTSSISTVQKVSLSEFVHPFLFAR